MVALAIGGVLGQQGERRLSRLRSRSSSMKGWRFFPTSTAAASCSARRWFPNAFK